MTDITDDDLIDLAGTSGLFALFHEAAYRITLAGDPVALGRLRRFAELARQDERHRWYEGLRAAVMAGDIPDSAEYVIERLFGARGSDK
jgi:hypothetical protein